MNKSLLSQVSAHHRFKPELPLISTLVGNLTPSQLEMWVWVLCPSVTVRPRLWEALAGGGPNLPCLSPKDPSPWILSSLPHLSCLSNIYPALQSEKRGGLVAPRSTWLLLKSYLDSTEDYFLGSCKSLDPDRWLKSLGKQESLMCWKCVFVKQTPDFSELCPGCGHPLQARRDISLSIPVACVSQSCHKSPEILQWSLRIPWFSLSRLPFASLNVSTIFGKGREGLRAWVMCPVSCCRIQVLPEAQEAPGMAQGFVLSRRLLHGV